MQERDLEAGIQRLEQAPATATADPNRAMASCLGAVFGLIVVLVLIIVKSQEESEKMREEALHRTEQKVMKRSFYDHQSWISKSSYIIKETATTTEKQLEFQALILPGRIFCTFNMNVE
ncbi:hypothetical protein TSAR_016725 [Trichomalopsis sarcophagae]|uniref:Uncharacterized protein n=1 Tax=Trichomalopsis sarcophagae TaxID=543379 RepID=A0A232EG00_9HYME|nr:hypothetical protein TSAR_016725 [Trichomalopsis sarcophagae]